MANNTSQILQDVGDELKANPPSAVQKTTQTKGPAQARKQKIAIMLNKARKRGAKIPGPKNSVMK